MSGFIPFLPPLTLVRRQENIEAKSPDQTKTSQVMASFLDNKLREDLERLKKIRAHRGLRHYRGVRSAHQDHLTGRRGKTVGVSKKK